MIDKIGKLSAMITGKKELIYKIKTDEFNKIDSISYKARKPDYII